MKIMTKISILLIALVFMAMKGDKPAYHIFDVKGRRILLNEDGSITDRVYFGDTPWLDHNNNNSADTYYIFTDRIDELIAQSDSLELQRWYLNDHLGTTYDLINNSANIVNHMDYESFGALREQSNPAEAVRHLFTGREYDALPNCGLIGLRDRRRGGDWTMA